MIRVNLLQVKRKKKAKPLPSFVVLGVLLALVFCLAVALVWMSQTKKIDTLNGVKNANQARIEALKKKVKEVDDFEAKIRQFEERKKVIVDLRKNQSVPVRIMNEISFVLADGVWLNRMSVKGDKISIAGSAFTNSNVVDFVNNLKRSSSISDVYLKETREAKAGKVSIFNFSLTFAIKFD